MKLKITRFRARHIAEDMYQVRLTVSGYFSMVTNIGANIIRIIGKHLIAKRGETREIVVSGKSATYEISWRDLEFLKLLKKQQKEYSILRQINDASRAEVDLILEIADIADRLSPS